MSSNIIVDDMVSINDCRRAVMALGKDITFLIQGEPGIGKSTLLPMIAAERGDKWRKSGDKYETDKAHYVYVDCPMKDVGDIAANIPVHDQQALVQYISAQFPRDGKPIIVMLDELLKANKLLKIMFTRLMLERCVGDWPLPEGSIVFATSNLQSDGVNDTIEGHVGNRVSILKMAKPTASEWLVWASENKIHASIRAWVAMTKEALRSYTEDGQNENPYVYNPARGTISYVSPRSLAKAGLIVSQRNVIGDEVTQAALAGTVGRSAAGNMAAFLALEKEIVRTEDVLKDPMGCALPEKPAAVFMMMFNAVDDIQTQDDLTAFMQFIDRVGSREVESVFFTMLVQGKRTVRLARGNKRVTEWAAKNIELF